MDTATFRVESSRQTDYEIHIGAFQMASNSLSPARAVTSFRPVTQAYFWTPGWQQKEWFADYDFLTGNVFEPTDVEDLIRHLHEAAEAS